MSNIFAALLLVNYVLVLVAMHFLRSALTAVNLKAEFALQECADLLNLHIANALVTAQGAERERLQALLERRTGKAPVPKAKA